MKKLLNIFLIVCISFSLPYRVIHADSSACQTEIVTNQSTGQQYCMPDAIYNYGTSSDIARYRAMIRTGNVGSDDIEMLTTWVLNEQNFRAKQLEGQLHISDYWQRLQLYGQRIFSGEMAAGNTAVLKYLLGLEGNNETSLFSAELNNVQQSPYRNYYTQGTNNVYNSGDTNYYKFFNETNNTFYYNNQYYNINNYEYNYYTYETNYYSTSYTFNYMFNIDNSVVNVIYQGVTTTYQYYYKLPDGRNSYNLTEDEIYGLKTDIYVDSYNTVSSNNNLLGLYHFDQNKNNSVYNGTNRLNIIPNTITYVDSQIGFNTALYLGAREKANPNYINISVGSGNTADFRMYLSDINDIGIIFGNDDNYSFIDEITTNITINTTGQTIINYSYWTTSSSQPNINCPSGMTRKGIFTTGNQGKNSNNQTIYEYSVACQITTSGTSEVPQTARVRVYQGNVIDNIRLNEWNHFVLHNNGSSIDLYINGSYIDNISYSNNGTIILQTYGTGYCLLDELRIVTGNPYSNSYIPSSTPYDDNVIFVLPDNVESGTLLIQSDIDVNNFQIGGVRPSNVSRGDVFILVNDIGLMTSIQQYDGSDWIEKKGAIYNENLGLWVSYYGYSIYTNNWDYTSLEELSVVDIETEKDFYSWLSAQFNKIIQAIESISIQNISNITNVFPESSNFWDFLINLIDDLMSGLNELVDKLLDFIKWLLIPEEFDMTETIDTLEYDLGILWLPFDLIADMIDYCFSEEPEQDYEMNFNGFTFMEVQIIPSFSYDLSGVFSIEPFSTMHNIYLNVIDVVLIISVINLAKKKFDETIGGRN